MTHEPKVMMAGEPKRRSWLARLALAAVGLLTAPPEIIDPLEEIKQRALNSDGSLSKLLSARPRVRLPISRGAMKIKGAFGHFRGSRRAKQQCERITAAMSINARARRFA